VLDGAALPAIRDGGKLATDGRRLAGPSERGITIEPVRWLRTCSTTEALDRVSILSPKGGPRCASRRLSA